MRNVIKYAHHGVFVSVFEQDMGKHRDHCLCWQNCKFFHPDDRENNCDIANTLYELDVKNNLVTPVWECLQYQEKNLINTKAEVNTQLVEDILVTAFEGGITYWCEKVTIPNKEDLNLLETIKAIMDGYNAFLWEVDGECYTFHKRDVVKGIQRYFNHLCKKDTTKDSIPSNIDEWDFDADDADAIIQCGLFGKIIFG